jgi:hypothetical protein
VLRRFDDLADEVVAVDVLALDGAAPETSVRLQPRLKGALLGANPVGNRKLPPRVVAMPHRLIYA